MRAIALPLVLLAPTLVSAAHAPLRKRISGYATWYEVQTGNAGSCGSFLSDSDYTVAMNQVQYTDSMCGQTITISHNGKSTQARIMDLCPTGGGNCNYGDMDMSPGLFQFFEDLGAGKIPIEWDFGGSQPQQPTTTQQPDPTPDPEPTTTYVYIPPPDTTTSTTEQPWTPPTTTSQPPTTSSAPPSSSSSSTSSSSSSSSVPPPSSSSSSSSSTSTAAQSTDLTTQSVENAGGNIANMNAVVVNMGALLRYAGGTGAKS